MRDIYLKKNANHYLEFKKMGYTLKNHKRLFEDIEKGFNINKAFDHKISKNGKRDRFSIMMKLGINKKSYVMTGWQYDSKVSKPRFITAHICNNDLKRLAKKTWS